MKNKMLHIYSVCLYILSIFFIYKGYDKMVNYNNPEIGTDYVNAYVGGDCYNYIISANYATGFFVLAMGFAIIATMLLITTLFRREN